MVEEDEDVWLALKVGDVPFRLGLSDVLDCVEFAESQGELPELPHGWLEKARHPYHEPDVATGKKVVLEENLSPKAIMGDEVLDLFDPDNDEHIWFSLQIEGVSCRMGLSDILK